MQVVRPDLAMLEGKRPGRLKQPVMMSDWNAGFATLMEQSEPVASVELVAHTVSAHPRAFLAVVTIAVAGRRGLLALLGLCVAALVVVESVLPALVAGQNPLWVGLTGSAAIIFVVPTLSPVACPRVEGIGAVV